MAIGRKTGGRDFEPGNNANPNGRPRVPEDVKQARKLTRMELERILNEYVYLSKGEITDRLKSTGTPALELIIGSIIVKAVTAGDQQRMNFLLDRLGVRIPESDPVEEEPEIYSRPPSMRRPETQS